MEESGETKEKGRVCVTGGTGFVASWLVMKLLQHGYSVNATVRSHPPGSSNNDLTFLTTLPKAQDRLQIFTADLSDPQSFKPAIEGCIGLFHVAHPMDFQGKESIDSMTDRSIRGISGILQICLDSGTVKRVVYTSSAATVFFKDWGSSVDGAHVDEDVWSDVEYMKKMNSFGAGYCISKTMTERAVLEFADNNKGLDVLTVIPTWIHGPFICPKLPASVHSSLGLIIGNENQVKYGKRTHFVHTDDVAEAHIHLFEYPEAKGRYICSSAEATIEELAELVSTRYPEFKLMSPEVNTNAAMCSFSTKKLLETGFKYKYGLHEMFDDAIECCRKKGFL